MHQRHVLDDIEALVRSRVDPDYRMPQPADYDTFDWNGVWQPHTNGAYELWRQWEDHGVMPDPTRSYWEQAPQWRRDNENFRRAYRIKLWEVLQEVRDRKDKPHGR